MQGGACAKWLCATVLVAESAKALAVTLYVSRHRNMVHFGLVQVWLLTSHLVSY